ncbi:MAG: histidine kinase [Bacteroidota bacterium]
MARLDVDEGIWYLDSGRYEQANASFQKALDFGRINQNQDLKVLALEKLSYLRRKQYEQLADHEVFKEGLFEEGVQFGQELLQILPESQFRAYIKLAKLYHIREYYSENAQDADSAFKYYREAYYSASKEAEEGTMAEAQENMGRLCIDSTAPCHEWYLEKFPQVQLTRFNQVLNTNRQSQNVASKRLRDYELTVADQTAKRSRGFLISGFAAGILLLSLAFLVLMYKARTQELNARLEALRSQINPHFVSNTINAIEGLVIRGNKEVASEYLADFAALSRRILYGSREGGHSLVREIDMLEKYLRLLKLRFEDKFNYEIDVAPSLAKDIVQMPAMMVQPFVENAFFHGINPKPEGGVINIRFIRVKTHLLIEIEDDGIGRENAKRIKQKSIVHEKSHGMAITRERIESINKSRKTKLTILDKGTPDAPLGTLVKILIPYQTVSK